MDTKTALRLGTRRFLIFFAISLVFIVLMSETSFYFLKEDSDRAPKEVQLIIPEGTAARVANGETVASIPDKMVFTLGDTLTVKNEDVVSHELGPLWIPAGSSASLVLEQASKFAYTCSFQPSRYLGLDVKNPTTWLTRLAAFGLATPATAFFLFFYSIIIWPIKPKKEVVQEVPRVPVVGVNEER
jgi:hypothetical protein